MLRVLAPSRRLVTFPAARNSLLEAISHNGLVDNLASLAHSHVRVHDNGYVQLVDCCPRLTPPGVRPESAVARAARVSTHMGQRPLQDDKLLISRLVADGHTSPLEALSFVFNIRSTIEVFRQFLRHRMFRPNEFSFRYRESTPNQGCPIVGSKREFMKRSTLLDGVRRQAPPANKQASISISDPAWIDRATQFMMKAEDLAQQQFDLYHQMCKHKVAREVARSYLPLATYSEVQVSCDANNLLKFWRLRCDRRHAQTEIADVAEAMRWLVSPLMPTIMEHYEATSATNGLL